MRGRRRKGNKMEEEEGTKEQKRRQRLKKKLTDNEEKNPKKSMKDNQRNVKTHFISRYAVRGGREKEVQHIHTKKNAEKQKLTG